MSFPANTAILMHSAKARLDTVPGVADVENGMLPELEKEQDDDEDNKKLCASRTLRTRIVHAVAILSIVLWGLAIALELSVSTYIAGAFTVVLAPIVIWFQLKLQDTDSMRQVQNALRKDVYDLRVENDKLSAEINLMEEQVKGLQEQEQRLRRITEKQGSNVQEFVALVKENRALIEKQKSVVRNDTAQLLSNIVINSDGNCDGSFSDQELRKLQARLRAIPGVKVNHNKLKESVDEWGGKMGPLLELINKVSFASSGDDDNGGNDKDRVFIVI